MKPPPPKIIRSARCRFPPANPSGHFPYCSWALPSPPPRYLPAEPSAQPSAFRSSWPSFSSAISFWAYTARRLATSLLKAASPLSLWPALALATLALAGSILFLGFTQIGWYAFTTAVIVQVLLELIGAPQTGPLFILLVFFFNYAFCATAYIGYRAIDWLSRLAVPAMLILVAISLSLAFRDYGSATIPEPTGELGMGTALAIVIGSFISGGTQATNWSRFANSGKNAVVSTLSAFFLVNGILVFAGAFCAMVYGSEDLIKAMASQGILAGGVILLILNVWTTQDNTIYSFSVAGANMFRTHKRHAFVLGGATFALVLTLSGIYDLLPKYLLLLGTLIPPIGGIIMVDFWLRYGGRFPALSTRLPAVNWAGAIAYIIGAAVAYVTGNANIGIGPVNGIVVAAILYGILYRVIPQPIRSFEA